MPKNALIFLAEGFEEIEAVTCMDILRRAGIQVTVAGLNAGPLSGSRGICITPDCDISLITEEYDAYVLPGGGPGAANLARSSQVKLLLQSAAQQNKIIAAICAAPAVVLAPLGLLKDKLATCYPQMEKEFPSDAKFIPKPVVVDHNLITSRGPATAMEFALTIVEQLAGENVRRQVAQAILMI